ncbi:MAG: class I SAM-dependent methyltransferase [Acidimicrobiia bacterium]|nr:class I SAM-dependent methyltransferase [Acidimicrobiia bacterium]
MGSAARRSSPSPSRRLSRDARQTMGRRAARRPLVERNAIWCAHSGDKPDCAEGLARVLRLLQRAAPQRRALRALSIGCGAEPQLPLLRATCTAAVGLLDRDPLPLAAIEAHVAAQGLDRVTTVTADYLEALGTAADARRLRRQVGGRAHLVLFHHSLYYSPRSLWPTLVGNAWRELLVRADVDDPPTAAVHAVLMASRSADPTTTSSLYARWAGRFFGAHNDQDLGEFARWLRRSDHLEGAQVATRRSTVRFDHPDFEAFMAVVWMLLLHPDVHCFSPQQQDEVTEWVYRELWAPGVPLRQEQHHLVLQRGSAER